ncbi:hypothetical protein RPMA_13285 [Tardiphaga alba]|uniref:Uncharacterized protein n=1 Tax=Tardiphaga alba TaxID=340268 RepID=A0ABX8A7T0_9BRAD|nr:hypothetical protein [Tardiphaga alba]QUS39702.1 hypothetical protein RPMA_13285 [Tardiphaga alba]
MKFAFLACLLTVTLGSNDAWSQGATGGSLGNDNKSLSGSSSEPREARPASRERSEPRVAPTRRNSGGDGGGSVARFDGRWRISFTGQTKICAGITADSTLTFSGGRGSDGSTVNSSGGFQGAANNSGVSAIMTGRLSGRSGGGSMRMSNGCSGRWTAVKL